MATVIPAPPAEWALVEVMGHARYAGRIEQVTVVGVPMLRVHIPGVVRQRLQADWNEADERVERAAPAEGSAPEEARGGGEDGVHGLFLPVPGGVPVKRDVVSLLDHLRVHDGARERGAHDHPPRTLDALDPRALRTRAAGDELADALLGEVPRRPRDLPGYRDRPRRGLDLPADAPSRVLTGRRSASRGVWASVLLHCGCGAGVVQVVRMRTPGGRVWAAVEQVPARRPEPVAVVYVPEGVGWSP